MQKKILTAIILLITMSGAYGQGWTLQNPLPTFQNIKDVSFPSLDTGYIVGDQTLMRTIDGGVTWSALTIPEPLQGKQIDNVNFVNNNRGYIGSGKCLYTTHDAGETWTYQVIQTWGDVNRSHFYDDTLGFVIGRYSLLARTVDGGASWQTISFNTGAEIHYDEIKFANTQTGYISGYTGGFHPDGHVLKRSDDGGLTWTDVNIPEEVEYITSMEVLSPDEIWIGAGNVVYAGPYTFHAYAYHTIDGGDTWTAHFLGSSSSELFGSEQMEFFDSDNGYILNAGHLYSTHDGGQTWNDKLFYLFSQSFVSFSWPNPQVCIIAGYGPALLKSTDAGLNFESLINGNNYVNYSVYFRDSLNGFVGGVKSMGSFINYTNDGGKTWNPAFLDLTLDSVSNPPEFHDYIIRDIGFSSETTGWAVFKGTVIYKTTDGGLNWYIGSTGIQKSVRWLSIPDEQTVFISGSTCSVIKTTDSGNSWVDVSPVVEGYTAYTRSVFINALTGYLPAQNEFQLGVLLKTQDGGITWTEIDYGSSGIITSISFADENNGIIGLSDKTIRYTHDGGETWQSSTVILPRNVTYLKLIDTQVAIATVDGDYAAISYNGGESFGVVYEGSLYWPWVYPGNTPTYFEDETTGWSASWNGMIMRFDLESANLADIVQQGRNNNCFIYPNPAKDYVLLKVKGNYLMEIIDSYGRMVHTETVSEGQRIDISKLPSGVYVVNLINDTGRLQQKFIK